MHRLLIEQSDGARDEEIRYIVVAHVIFPPKMTASSVIDVLVYSMHLPAS